MYFMRILAVSLLPLSTPLFADEFDINMNNSAVQLRYDTSAGIGEGPAKLRGGLLMNDSNNLLAEVGVAASGGGGEEGAGAPVGGGGLKGLFGSIQKNGVTSTVAGIAIGLEGGYGLPTAVPVNLVGEYQFALKIISFLDSERFSQYGLRIEVAASPQAKIYVGYREISFGIKDAGSAVLDSGTHIGMRLSF